MPQKTNLNINPYYDDFDADKNFYKVLFKPGYPIQSRELTTLQSILQNQIESFGNHVFKNGSVVVPGNVTYDSQFYAVKLNSTHLGINVSLYASQLVGKKIRGQTSQVTATVKHFITESESEEGYLTLYVNYNKGNDNFEFQPFSDGETLIIDESIQYENTIISSGETIASLIDFDSTSIGSAVFISEGIYFIRGVFVQVSEDILILEQYTNKPSYRVGLSISEEIVSAKNDTSLYDNAKGFSNYAAPGADRFKISTSLSKKSLDDYDDKDFLELLKVINGEIQVIKDKPEYSDIKNYLAKRTYEESGNYSVVPFEVEIQNSLNDRIGSNGLYLEDQLTAEGNIPNDDLMCVKVSPGIAYVKGFDIDKNTLTIIDSKKPRTIETIDQTSIPFEMGNLLKVDNVTGVPVIGLNNNYYINLQNQRKNSTTVGTGTTIGQARVYSFNPSNIVYENQSSKWDLYLYDIQTYTELTLNTSVSGIANKSSYVRGKSSNASGYLISSSSSNLITLSQTSGNFIVGEELQIDGRNDITTSIKSVKVYNVDDIKSVYQSVSGITGFNTSFIADTVLERSIPNNFNITDKIYISSSGVATCPGRNFVGIKSDSIIKYQRTGLSTETYNRVLSVSSNGLSLTLSGVATVTGVCDGGLVSQDGVTFSLGVPSIQNEENSFIYSKLNHTNISNVDLSDSSIFIAKQVTGKTTDSNGSLTISISDVGITSAFFESFDTERYSVFYDDGQIESLSQDQFTLASGGQSFIIKGLRSTKNVVVNTTLRKNVIKNKNKFFSRSKKLYVDRTKYKSSEQFGLTYNTYYGLRVEDEEISLNVPDVVNILGIYESLDSSNPIFDKLTFVSSLNLNSTAILGEKIQGKVSGAIGQIITLLSNSSIEFIYLNTNKFIIGEEVVFAESNINGILQDITLGQYLNKTSNYILDKGQKQQYYDYSKIIRTVSQEPVRKLAVVFNYYTIPSDDIGDIYTVNSYPSETYASNIPFIDTSTRCSDILDFRPRVSDFSDTSSSPFAFTSRNFAVSGINPSIVVSPNESCVIGYSYYLPRIDKLVLDKTGEFKLISGTPSLNPKEPQFNDDILNVASIFLPAYLYSPDDVKITLIDNKRYTMRDIGKLEDRIESLETTTSLSILELDTKTLQIQDADGLSRFKCGFFVDDFKSVDLMDIENQDTKCSILNDRGELSSRIDLFSLKPEIAPASNINLENIDYNIDYDLLDSNVQKTGDLITLKYNQIKWNNLQQLIATRVTPVNPYEVVEYNGSVSLYPPSDFWIRDVILDRGTTRSITGSQNTSYTENVLLSTTSDLYMRSRNVKFFANGLDPLTKYYSFLDANKDIDIIPKLLEITMVSGQFTVGETVYGYLNESSKNNFRSTISFKVAQQNHKEGAIDNPSKTYNSNPYNSSLTLSGYNSSSTVLNIDVTSLSQEAKGQFFGYVEKGMTLIGGTSKAQATVSDIRLISDTYGDLVGSFFIREPNTIPSPLVRIKTGTKVFKVSSSSIDASLLPKGYVISSAETIYSATGIVRTFDRVTVNVIRRHDPLAQSFTTDQDGGFLSSIDLWFYQADEGKNVTVEIRPVDLGLPMGRPLYDYARVELTSDQIITSQDASKPTNIKFPSPIYLQPNTEYAIVILSPKSKKYYVHTAKKNEKNVSLTDLPDVESVVYNIQYTGGSLFKSQNGTVWTPYQDEDLKFRCYKCNFTSNTGTCYFYNPDLSKTALSKDTNVYNTINDPITTFPRKVIIGIDTSSSLNNILTPGVKVEAGSGSGVIGYIEKVGGPVAITTTVNVGAGYSSATSFTNVSLYSEIGSGFGARASGTFNSSGQLNTISIASTGSGYVVGDVLGITTADVGGKGTGIKIGISSIGGIDKLYLTNVKGEKFDISPTTTLVYYNNNSPVSLSGTYIKSSSQFSDLHSGKVIEIYDYSHGMHASNNLVSISNVFPTTLPVKIVNSITSSSNLITVDNVGIFTTFEGQPVGASNTGYVLINNEIIAYNSPDLNANTILIDSRGIDGSLSRTHDSGSLAYKYELNDISLRRINTSHSMIVNSSSINNNKTIDTYQLEIDRGSRETGTTQISFGDQRFVGGSDCVISQNIQYNSISPLFSVITPGKTSVSAEIRTVSATSASGSEVSFIDQQYEQVQINSPNNLSTPRIIASKINETTRLTDLPNNKSFTLGITLNNDGNSNYSPVIDTGVSGIIVLGRNRINKPVANYVSNSGANLNVNDPHASIYISKKVTLQKPATSLKVLISSYRDSSADFRILYKLFKSDSSEITQAYVPFPGYNNLTDTNGDGFGDKIIDVNLNDGLPDKKVRSSAENEFLEYEFTADQLDPFNAFVIKIVMSGSNEAKSPLFKDLRVIALA